MTWSIFVCFLYLIRRKWRLLLNFYHSFDPIRFRIFGGMAIFLNLKRYHQKLWTNSEMLQCYEFWIFVWRQWKHLFLAQLKRAFLEWIAHVHIKRKTLLPLFTFSFNYTIISIHHIHSPIRNHFHFQLFFHVNVSSCLFDTISVYWTLMQITVRKRQCLLIVLQFFPYPE